MLFIRSLTALILIGLLSFFGCRPSPSSHEMDRLQSTQVTTLENSLAQLKSIGDPDSLIMLASLESEKLDELLSDSLLALYYQQSGLMLYAKSIYDLSEEYFLKSQHFYENAGLPSAAIRMLANRAVLNELKGNYKEAIDMYLKAAYYFSDQDDSLSLAHVYTNIAVVYEEMGVPGKALEYNKSALFIRQQKKDTLSTATNFNNIGVIFDEYRNQPDSALYYYQRAEQIYRTYHAPAQRAYALNNVARMHLELNKQDLASRELATAYGLMDSLNNLHGKAKVLRNQGELYFSQMNSKKAIEAFRQALALFKNLNDQKSLLEMSELMSKAYLASGNYPKAIEFMSKQNQLKDSLMNTESKAVIAEMETRFQVKEKNKTIKLLELQDEMNNRRIKNQIGIITLLTVIFLLILIVFLINYNRNKLKQQQLRLELQNYVLQIHKMESEIKETRATPVLTPDFSEFDEFELTDREKEVMHMIARGYKNSEIAEKLFVSENTVKTHIKNIYVKLDVKNRVEALKRVKLVQ